jgi:hypothetical protein
VESLHGHPDDSNNRTKEKHMDRMDRCDRCGELAAELKAEDATSEPRWICDSCIEGNAEWASQQQEGRNAELGILLARACKMRVKRP